jgi:hypothetical protein
VLRAHSTRCGDFVVDEFRGKFEELARRKRAADEPAFGSAPVSERTPVMWLINLGDILFMSPSTMPTEAKRSGGYFLAASRFTSSG